MTKLTDTNGLGAEKTGFPQPEGKKDTVIGKNFEIWKVDTENPVDDELRGVIRTFCEELVQAVNSYYAFGSIFSDDAT
eukprot:jgi/Botrbrau1/12512/Bobra.0169s0054.1